MNQQDNPINPFPQTAETSDIQPNNQLIADESGAIGPAEWVVGSVITILAPFYLFARDSISKLGLKKEQITTSKLSEYEEGTLPRAIADLCDSNHQKPVCGNDFSKQASQINIGGKAVTEYAASNHACKFNSPFIYSLLDMLRVVLT